MTTTDSAREKMLAGQIYYSPDAELAALHTECQNRLQAFNAVQPGDMDEYLKAAKALFGRIGDKTLVRTPLMVEYGCFIEIGDFSFVNMGCSFLDCGGITIGNQVGISTGCQFLGITHPVDYDARFIPNPQTPDFPMRIANQAKPIVLEDGCWLGGGVIVLPGVTIGARSVIGAGSVVTKDIPPDVVAAGNPCRVIRSINKTT